MHDDFIFWHQPLKVTGTAAPADAIRHLEAQTSVGRFGGTERLAGKLAAPRIRVWRRAAIAASDVVQFEGEVRAHDGGTAIEGRLSYTPATRLQFTGCLVLGLALAAGGALDRTSGATPGIDLLGVGAFISIVTVFWIYAASRMRGTQIDFIEGRLKTAAEASAAPRP